jgi:hypothetical protein
MPPRDAALPRCVHNLQTVIITPTKNYTVLEQKQLMLDMGDVGGVSDSLHWQHFDGWALCSRCQDEGIP